MAIIQNYERPTAVNPFKADVDALIDAGENAAYELIGQTEKTEGVRGTIASRRARFQDAAREAGYSARVVESEDREDGTTRLVLVLAPKRTHKRKADADKSAAKGK